MLAASRKAVAPMFETTVCYPWATSGAGWGLQRIADCSFATGSQLPPTRRRQLATRPFPQETFDKCEQFI